MLGFKYFLMRETGINAITALIVSVAILFIPTVAIVAPVIGGIVFGVLQSKDEIRENYLLSMVIGGLFGVIAFLLAAGFFITTPIVDQAAINVQEMAFGFLAELHPIAYALIAGMAAAGTFITSSLIVSEFDIGRGRPPSPTNS